jgi:hypothetical protein
MLVWKRRAQVNRGDMENAEESMIDMLAAYKTNPRADVSFLLSPWFDALN